MGLRVKPAMTELGIMDKFERKRSLRIVAIVLLAVLSGGILGFTVGTFTSTEVSGGTYMVSTLQTRKHILLPSASSAEPEPTIDTLEGLLININTATLDELQLLPSIGEKTAQMIIDYRTDHGNFATPSDIMNVKGIGQATYERFAEYITTIDN